MEQLRADGWVNNISEGAGGFVISSSPPTAVHPMVLTLDDDILETIIGSIEFYYSIGTMIEHFGSPEGLYLDGQEGRLGCSCAEQEYLRETVAYYFDILYPSQGLLFAGAVPMGARGCICPEMKVVAYCYHSPLSMSEALSNNRLADLCAEWLEGVAEENIVEWHGFGDGY